MKYDLAFKYKRVRRGEIYFWGTEKSQIKEITEFVRIAKIKLYKKIWERVFSLKCF